VQRLRRRPRAAPLAAAVLTGDGVDARITAMGAPPAVPSPVARERWLTGLALAGLALLVLVPWLGAGPFPRTHESLRYVLLLEHFGDAVRHGVPYPRFLPELYGGYGYPIFCFYQPGFFFFALPATWLPLDSTAQLTLVLFLLLWLGAGGAYALGRLWGSRGVGLCAAAWLLLTPYLYVNLYVRGDLSELMGMLVAPWAVWAALLLDRRVRCGGGLRGPALALAVAVAVLVTSHPAAAVVLLPGLAGLGVVLGLRHSGPGPFAWRFAAALLLGLALAAPYWGTLLELRSSVDFGQLVGDTYQPELHGATPRQLVSREWSFGASGPGPDDGLPMALGLPHLLLAAVGAWLGRRRPVVVTAALGYALLVVLVLDVASPLWARAGPLRFLQFPWRLLGPAATLGLVAALGAAPALTRLGARARTAVLVGLPLAAALWYAPQFATAGPLNVEDERRALAAIGFQHSVLGARFEYLPLTARVRPSEPRRTREPLPTRRPRHAREVVWLEGTGGVKRRRDSNPQRLRYRVQVDSPATLHIDQLYLPGWSVRLDDRDVPTPVLEAQLTPEGTMTLVLEPGRYQLEAGYAGAPGAGLRNRIAGLAALALAALLLSGWPPRR